MCQAPRCEFGFKAISSVPTNHFVPFSKLRRGTHLNIGWGEDVRFTVHGRPPKIRIKQGIEQSCGWFKEHFEKARL